MWVKKALRWSAGGGGSGSTVDAPASEYEVGVTDKCESFGALQNEMEGKCAARVGVI